MKKVWVAAVVACVACLPGSAQGKIVDTEDTFFSIDLGAARICFIEPVELRSAEDCAQVDIAAMKVTPIDRADGVRLAVGVIRLPGEPTDPRLMGVLTITKFYGHAKSAPDQAEAERFMNEALPAFTTLLPPGARLVTPPPRIVLAGDLPVVRMTVGSEGVPPGTPAEIEAHRELVHVIGGTTSYLAVWSGRPEHARELARYADAAALATKLAPEARPSGAFSPTTTLVASLVSVIVLLLALFAKRHRARAKVGRGTGLIG
jgi:hypothetical protein